MIETEVKGALIGTLLGDSYISEGNRFGCEQITESLIEQKAELLSYYMGKIPNISIRTRKNQVIYGRSINNKPIYTVRACHSVFVDLYKQFYNSDKQVSTAILEQLTDKGLAWWVMDDGYMNYDRSSNTRNLRICTDSFNIESINNIVEYFRSRYGVTAKIYYAGVVRREKGQARISFSAKDTQKLITIIYKYFVPELMYKLDMHYKESTIKSKRCSIEYRAAYKYIQEVLNEQTK